MNGKFFALPQERQEQIINAAYGVFSRNSYKNASMSRLADAGGVSKSLLFHYFLNLHARTLGTTINETVQKIGS